MNERVMNGDVNGGEWMKMEWYTITQTAEKTEIPADTVRRYVRSHRGYLKTRKRGNSYQIHLNSLSIVHEIRRLYDEGMNGKDVEEHLSGVHPLTIEVIDESKQTRQTIDVALALHEMREGFMEVVNRLQEDNTKLHKELATTQKVIKSYQTSHEQGMNELKQTVNESYTNAEEKREQEVNVMNNSMNELKESLNEVKKQEWSTLTMEEVREAINPSHQKGWFSRLFGK